MRRAGVIAPVPLPQTRSGEGSSYTNPPEVPPCPKGDGFHRNVVHKISSVRLLRRNTFVTIGTATGTGQGSHFPKDFQE